MFNKLVVPPSHNSSYLGIFTDKENAVEYSVGNDLSRKTVVFIEGTNEVSVVGEPELRLNGTWILSNKEEGYRCAIGIVDNQMTIVADKNGISWQSDWGTDKVFKSTLEAVGIYDRVLEGFARRGRDD